MTTEKERRAAKAKARTAWLERMSIALAAKQRPGEVAARVAARKRNRRRNNYREAEESEHRQAQSAGLYVSLRLTPSEVATLAIARGVTIRRQIWPQRLYKQAWCQYGTPGMLRRVQEDCKYFGADPEHAVYCYSNEPQYHSHVTNNWLKLKADAMPLRAARFVVVIKSTVRSEAKHEWTMVLERVSKNGADAD